MSAAFLREPLHKPDGGKIYARELMWVDRVALSEAISTGNACVYVCGEYE